MRTTFLVTVSIIILGMSNSAVGGLPAARFSDLVICPAITGLQPHVGGPITGEVAFTVRIGGFRAATVGSTTLEVGASATIVLGSSTVFIEGRPAARVTDPTDHGGTIMTGFQTVLIGD